MMMTPVAAMTPFAVGTELIMRTVLLRFCHLNGRMKHRKQIIELLKLRKKFLFDSRDALKEEITKELTRGKKPTRECQKWLKRVEEIETRANDMLKYELKSSTLDTSLRMEQRERLMNMLDEIAKYLENSPYDHGRIVDSPNEVTGRMATQRIESKAQGPVKKTQRVKLWSKDTTATPKVEAKISKATPEVDTARSKAELEVETASAKEKQLIEEGMKAQTKAKLKVETAKMKSLQIPEAHERDIVETVIDPSEERLPIQEIEIIEETDQRKTKPSIEPILPSFFAESGPSNEAMVEIRRVPSFKEKDNVLPIGTRGETKGGPEVDTARSKDELEVETASVKEKQLIEEGMKAQTKVKPKVETAKMKSLQIPEAHERDIVETVIDASEERLHIQEIEIIEETDQRKTKPSIEPILPSFLAESGPSNEAMVEIRRVPSFKEKDNVLPIGTRGETKGGPEVDTARSKVALEVETASVKEKQLIEVRMKAQTKAKPKVETAKMKSLQIPEAHERDIVETVIDATEERLPIQEIEIIEETDQMKPEPSIEPILPAFVSESAPSNAAMVEIRRVLSFKEKDNVLPIGTRGATKGGPLFSETILNAKRSTQRTVQMILGCITDGKAEHIGIYGIGGIGKTTVLKALTNDPKAKCAFDVIIWVTVSRHWSIRKIQNQIAVQLAVTVEDSEADSEIAKKLLRALENKKFLLLLDDVWEKINLVAVGVPNFTVEDGCRVILATRSEKVCDANAATKIKVEVLSREEAWELFHERVDQNIDSANFQPYARAIVDQCGGLPLLIIVIGTALAKENEVQVWKHALNELLLAQKDVIKQLKFSYDRLKARELQNCFLYCSLFPEDHEVSISELVVYWIQEGLISGKLVDARKKGYDIANVLTEAALLESAKEGLCIKMHDAVRDLASLILSPEAEGCQFLVRADSRLTLSPNLESSSSSKPPDESSERFKFLFRAGARLKEPPKLKEWEEANMIFLMDNEFSSMPESPSCSELSSLFLQRNHRLRVIPESFFKCMSSLQVLNLSKTRINSLPKSVSNLTGLQVLLLRNCERLVRLPPEVRFLEQLEVLDLHGTEINQLPKEIGELARLKNLEVSFYGSFDHKEYSELPPVLIPCGMLSTLLALTNLSIVVYPGDQRWNKIAESVILDILKLSNLTALCLHFPDVRLLQLFLESSPWKDNKLEKFNFVVGHEVKRIISRVPRNVEFEYNQRSQCLRFVNDKVIPEAVVEILTHTTAFYLDHHFNIHSLSEFGVRNIAGLEFCVLRECPKIETIIDSEELTLPFLEHLSIHYLQNLRKIWRGLMPSGSFASLKYLSVHTCPRLTFIVTSSMSKCLSNLEELTVEDCQAIIEIISEDTIVKPGDVLLPRLKKLTLHHLLQLVSIWKGSWPSLEHISFYNCPCLKNHHMGPNSELKDTIEGV